MFRRNRHLQWRFLCQRTGTEFAGEVIDGMPDTIAIWQIITNATLTAVAICIASASLIVAYRNNFGWPPIALISGQGLAGVGPTLDNISLMLTMELWNRQKYPIHLRSMTIKFKGAEIRRDGFRREGRPPEEIQWFPSTTDQGHIHSVTSKTVAPTEHLVIPLEVPFKTSSLDALHVPVNVQIMYFDPRRNGTYILKFDFIYRTKDAMFMHSGVGPGLFGRPLPSR